MLNESSLYKENLMETINGMEFVYTTLLSVFFSIDLSSNIFYGEIPKDRTNLYRNHFTGEILKILESWDS